MLHFSSTKWHFFVFLFKDYESRLEALQKQVDRCYPDVAEEDEEPEEEGEITKL